MARLNPVERAVNRWLTTPEVNAAGRLGIFRVIYALSALLFVLPISGYALIATMPTMFWYPVPIVRWLSSPPPAWSLMALESAYIGGLVLLAIGLQVRMMTVVVLVSGTLYSALSFSFTKIDHAGTFMHVYIPAVMLFAPWGMTFSLDAVLRARRGLPSPAPTESSLRYSWHILFLLALLSVMYMTGGLVKAIPPGQWIVDPDLMRKFMLEYNRNPNPVWLRYQLAQLPIVPTLMLWVGLLFETLYPLALVNHRWRKLVVASSVFFHIGTGVSLGIQFTPLLFFYILFFDLYSVYQRWFPKAWLRPVGQALAAWSTPALVGGSIGLAVLLVGSHYFPLSNAAWTLLYELMANYIWWLAAPIAAYNIIRVLPTIVRGLVGKRRQRISGVSAQS